MRIVLLSGGSGKRLWPLSNDTRSKQFLKVLEGEDGQTESMVQRVWRQLERTGLGGQAVIATSKPQVEILRSQLGYDVDLVVEPERRDTFPAIALAAVYLYSVQGAGLNETVVMLPVDPYVDESFFYKVTELESVLHESGAELALIGVKPTYPSEKYGYIIPEQLETKQSERYTKVSRFHEKPREAEAAEMIEQSALWNCGVFAFKLNYLINLLISLELPIQYEEMLKQYGRLQKISFDYQVVEKARHIVVTPYEGYWKDLGTWNTLTDEMSTHIVGKGVMTNSTVNTHLINELNIPVCVLGVSNLIVAASPDGILVSEKEASPQIKEVLKDSAERPMYEERRWGCYKVLDYTRNVKGEEVLTKRIIIEPNKNFSYQYHLERNEVWTVVSGQGEFILDGELRPLHQGDVVVIPAGGKHSVKAVTELEIIEVQMGRELVEEDIVRVEMEWQDILLNCVNGRKTR